MKKKPLTIKNIAKLNQRQKTSALDTVIDKWVNKEEENLNSNKKIIEDSDPIEETRLTILIPTYLHRRIKKYCASHSLSMKKKIIEIFKDNFPET